MKKFPKIKRINHESVDGILGGPVTVLEKMDGANFRFTMGKNVENAPDDKLVFGSRNVVYKNEKDVDKNFEHAIEYVRNRIENTHPDYWGEHIERGDDSLTIYGEAMHAHTLEYGEAETNGNGAATWANVPNVLIFDVWSEQDGWLQWPSVKAVARRLNIPTVPAIYEGRRYEDGSELPENPESEYRDGVAEGVVVRRTLDGEALRAKLRTQEFLDKHGGGAPASQPEPNPDDSVLLARKLLRQEPWVEKQIHRYRDRGRTIEMSIMEDLWRDVFDDIIEEEYETILLGNWDINTKRFRSEIADHTATVLRQYLERPDKSALNQA